MKCPTCGGSGQQRSGIPCDLCQGESRVCDFCQHPLGGETPETSAAGGYAHLGCLADYLHDQHVERTALDVIEAQAEEHRTAMEPSGWRPPGWTES
jgi:hypothetical protein